MEKCGVSSITLGITYDMSPKWGHPHRQDVNNRVSLCQRAFASHWEGAAIMDGWMDRIKMSGKDLLEIE